ncbi:MAG: hypothetical protein EXQ70_04385 [Solirubrobacterales bacterium]|nr:hypothetical protein [Solirubrobacterales bacterium]
MAEGQARVAARTKKSAAGGRQGRRKKKAPACEDCFFGVRRLCALGLSEPCPTFRPNTARGLEPPAQPALLARQH